MDILRSIISKLKSLFYHTQEIWPFATNWEYHYGILQQVGKWVYFMLIHMLWWFFYITSLLLWSNSWKHIGKIMTCTFFPFAAISPYFTWLLQSPIGTHMLNNSWNSWIVSDIPSALKKEGLRSHKVHFLQFAADLAIFGKLLQSLKVAAGQRNFVQRLIDTLRGTI